MSCSVDRMEIPGPQPPPGGRSFSIIVADDDQTDVLLLKKALEQGSKPVHLFRTIDGDQLLRFLQDMRHGQRVDLVLLDLNMPGVTGHETLRRIRADSKLRTLPVVVLTTSRNRDDVDASYLAGANGYVSKNPDFARFADDISSLVSFWGETATLPTHGA